MPVVALLILATTPLQCIAVASPSPAEAAVGVQSAFPPLSASGKWRWMSVQKNFHSGIDVLWDWSMSHFRLNWGCRDVVGCKYAKLKDSSCQCQSQEMCLYLEMGTDLGKHNGACGVPGGVFFVSGVK